MTMAASIITEPRLYAEGGKNRDAASAPGPGQAVLGYARGCGISEIAPFVRSLRSVFSGHVILVVDRRPTLLAWLATHGVTAVIASQDGIRRRSHPVTARFAAFAQILHDRPDIDHVVLAPVRDVVFQSDPFGRGSDPLRIYAGAGLEEAVDRVFGGMPGRRGHRGPMLGMTRRACAGIAVVAGSAAEVARLS